MKCSDFCCDNYNSCKTEVVTLIFLNEDLERFFDSKEFVWDVLLQSEDYWSAHKWENWYQTWVSVYLFPPYKGDIRFVSQSNPGIEDANEMRERSSLGLFEPYS